MSKVIDVSLKMFGQVLQLHDLGYSHGNIKPRHFLMKDDLVFLIDYTQAQEVQRSQGCDPFIEDLGQLAVTIQYLISIGQITS